MAPGTPPRDGREDGEYRLRETVSVLGDVLVSRRPLTATRLNDAALAIVEDLEFGTFHTPTEIAGNTDHDVETVRGLCETLTDRDFLEWRPNWDQDYRPPVSVVVTVRNDRDHLERCLEALERLDYPAYEIVVVDDGSSDGSRELVRERETTSDQVRLVVVGDTVEPIGIGTARNRGVAAAEYDTIAFTDADCRPGVAWLDELVPYVATADLVGGRVRPAGGSPASAYEAVNSSLDMGPHAARVDPAGRTPYLPTANLVGRREVFETVPFPERNVAEDVEVCWEALEAGFDVVYTPTGVVEHAYREGLRAFAARRAAYGASEALLAATHPRRGQRVAVPILAVFVLAALTVGVLTSGTLALGSLTVGGVVLGLTGAIRGWRGWRQTQQLETAVSPTDLVWSWGRQHLSRVYAVSREVTRYYALPLVFLAGLSGALGFPWLAVGGFGLVTAMTVLPAVVEYRLKAPETSRRKYAVYYLADHLGYQVGVYRGALTYRTVGHLWPGNRFRFLI